MLHTVYATSFSYLYEEVVVIHFTCEEFVAESKRNLDILFIVDLGSSVVAGF